MGANPLRVVMAEDEALIRRGLEVVLADGDFEIVRIVGTADELIAAVRDESPALVITDIRMPPGFTNEGLAAALEIRRTWPAIPVCVLSQYVLAHSARALLNADGGGIGYLLKQRITHIDDFLSDLRRIVAGEIVLDPSVVEQLLARADRAGTPAAQLTPRQRAVLTLVAEGRSNAAIAARLFISEKTVVNHLTSIYMTLGLEINDDSHRRVQAVLAYLSSR
ncbi:LuxR C-terminal-related transcriptional regulator [Variovorax sp. M-6]|uniref:LuxR C-terminal-related transcriptional regulator n=1 Tax=Variovorax sp. M-6 TaxID=3233041 RepID=UPI003F9BC945